MRRGQRHTPAARRRISEATKRALKPWRDGLRVLPDDIRGFMQRGQVAPSIKPAVAAATQLLGEFAEDLGGKDQLAAGQRVGLTNLFRNMVVANSLFANYLRSGDPSDLDRVSAFANSEQRALAMLGLERTAKDVEPFHTFLERKAAEAGADEANSNMPSPEVEADRATDGEEVAG